MRIKKRISTKEEYLNCREEWNKKREETKDERNRRECEEMLEEIKEEKKELKQLIEQVNKGNIEINIKDELNKITSLYVKKSDIPLKLRKEMKYNLTNDEMKQLEDWTELKCGDILFDSNVDDWAMRTSVFDSKIKGKKQLIFLIEDENDEKFGYYLNTEIVEKYVSYMNTDDKSFLFNLQSNGRLTQPMKFEIKNTRLGFCLYKSKGEILSWLGDICLNKEEKKKESYCKQIKSNFNYQEIENAICGKQPNQDGEMQFTPKRIIVIQMN